MSKRPVAVPSTKQTTEMTSLGVFLSYWAIFDLIVEMLIQRELRLSDQEASIVSGGLNFQAKISILFSLLNRSQMNRSGFLKLKEAVALAERNDFVHGFMTHFRERSAWTLVRRRVREKYTVRAEPLDATAHTGRFIAAVDGLMEHFSISDRDVDRYAKSIEAEAPTPSSQDARRPKS